jgi:hypothetical protein
VWVSSRNGKRIYRPVTVGNISEKGPLNEQRIEQKQERPRAYFAVITIILVISSAMQEITN